MSVKIVLFVLVSDLFCFSSLAAVTVQCLGKTQEEERGGECE